MPELVASLCTLLVLAPLALMPGLGEFLYRPMAAGVAFAMISAYLLSRTFVPVSLRQLAQAARGAWTRASTTDTQRRITTTITIHSATSRPTTSAGRAPRPAAPRFRAVGSPDRGRDRLVRPPARPRDEPSPGRRAGRPSACWRRRSSAWARSSAASSSPRSIRAPSRSTPEPPSGTRIEETEKMIARVEQFVREKLGEDLQIDHLRARRRRRPVGRVHPQRRPDGRRRQGPAQARARALGPGICPPAPHRLQPRTPVSATWSLPSTPAA